MFRGTTPTLYFKINNIEDLSTIKELNITFKTKANKCCKHEDGKKMIKTLKDVTIDMDENIIALDLSQQDTLSLRAPVVLIQIKFMFIDDKVCASTICELPVEDPLDDRIMKIRPLIPGGGDESEDPDDTPTEPGEDDNPDEPAGGDENPGSDEGGSDTPGEDNEEEEETPDPEIPDTGDETPEPGEETEEENP